jgi:hypothetical protein
MTNEKLCCDLEHAKLLAETGLMGIILVDGYWQQVKPDGTWSRGDGFIFVEELAIRRDCHGVTTYETYRFDKIRAVLPEWCSVLAKSRYLIEAVPDRELRDKIIDLIWKTVKRGQPAANAAAKLLHLLWEEKLI